MASSVVQSNRFKKMQSKKSHSWWWDSHISPKNSRWLAENLEEMDKSVRRMLKLIEEDGDSFAKKAEMYYQKRPELIALVEEFYRMYRSLAERYDHLTGELKKSIPSDLQSQGSGASDVSSETSSLPPAPEQKQSHRRSSHRAAGFDFFLRSGGSSSDLQKEDETSSLTDSETESDNSSVHNYTAQLGNGSDHTLNLKIIELETELRELKERLQAQQEENGDHALGHTWTENPEDLLARISEYEQDLKTANQRIRDSEEEVTRLKVDLQRYKSVVENGNIEEKPESDMTRLPKLEQENIGELEAETGKIQALAEELRTAKEKLQNAEKEILSLKHQLETDTRISTLQDQLALAHKDINTWKTKRNAEKREVSKLQERISRLKTSLSDRDHEVRDLKIAVSDAEENIFPEKAQIKAELSKFLDERRTLEQQLREVESRNRSLEDQIRVLQTEMSEREDRHSSETNQLKEEIAERSALVINLNKNMASLKLERDELNVKVTKLKADVHTMEKHLQELHMEHVKLIMGAEEARKCIDELRSKADELEEEVKRQKVVIQQGAEEKREAIRQLCFSLEHYRDGYQRLREAFVGVHRRVPVFAV